MGRAAWRGSTMRDTRTAAVGVAASSVVARGTLFIAFRRCLGALKNRRPANRKMSSEIIFCRENWLTIARDCRSLANIREI